MKVLMFGWEFPPYMSGGLGTACYGMTTALAATGTDILFVVPSMKSGFEFLCDGHLRLRSASDIKSSHIVYTKKQREILHNDESAKFVVPEKNTRKKMLRKDIYSSRDVAELEALWHEHLRIHPLNSSLFPYATASSYADKIFYAEQIIRQGSVGQYTFSNGMDCSEINMSIHENWSDETEKSSVDFERIEQESNTSFHLHGGYGADLMSEVYRYSQAALGLLQEDFDVIHVHDWMTYPTGMLIKKLTGKPLIAHIHAMESDRSGDNPNKEVAEIEKAGLEAADIVVAVSHYTKSRVCSIYGIPPNKVRVVHNAVAQNEARSHWGDITRTDEKRVLFMGRVTYQKGPEYFVEAARLVLDRMPNVRFIMAGSGDMLARMVRLVAHLRMGNRFHFTGFLRGEDVDRMYAMSDLYVMPSVSEPFGIAPLEAMAYDVPVIISRQSGVSEVVSHALKVNFWDIYDMADKICAVLSYPHLVQTMVYNCREELKAIQWSKAASALNQIYQECTSHNQ